VVGLGLAFAACDRSFEPGPAPVASAPVPRVTAATAARRTTSGAIAVANLQSQIDGAERLGRAQPLPVAERLGLAELKLLRGQVLGRISDYEAVAEMAEALVREAPRNPRVRLLRAGAAATLHRFSDALAEIGEAEALGAPPSDTDKARAGVLHALGRSADALAIRRRATAARPDIVTRGDEAVVRAALGELDAAEALFAAAVADYRDVSPFPVAWIEFQRGLVWMREGELERARDWFAAAHARLPEHVQAAGHLGEVEAALGNVDRAVALLRPLAETVEDPDYAAQLARILGEAGRADEAKSWRDRAAARYDALTTKHPEAYADHAAEFWLAAGADPKRALQYAERNLALRPTVRAWELVLRAARAAGDGARACAAATGAREAGYLYASARKVVDEVLAECPGCAE
jgi:tetratricopeptide (TPR) repeat protein